MWESAKEPLWVFHGYLRSGWFHNLHNENVASTQNSVQRQKKENFICTYKDFKQYQTEITYFYGCIERLSISTTMV